jgi:hypothetical protein
LGSVWVNLKDMDWSQRDRDAFLLRKWVLKDVDAQLLKLRTGHNNRVVSGPCRLQNGISKWSSMERDERNLFASSCMEEGEGVVVFIPASGAATRMFKELHLPLRGEVAEKLLLIWEQLPFASMLRAPEPADSALQAAELANQIMRELDMGSWPKGHIPFFVSDSGEPMTAFEAHQAEWQQFGSAHLIFTVPIDFQQNLPEKYRSWERVTWEIQRPETDALAWDLERKAPARFKGGELILRPGGHGALLDNLNDAPDDLVVVRNIDNAVPVHLHESRNAWRGALLGSVIHLEAEREALWERLERGESDAEEAAWRWLSDFVRGVEKPKSLGQWRYHLHRPIRVAGVVPNAGQAGGGPFWVADGDGFFRPGIAESSELPEGLLAAGTHFNPVELALSLRGLGRERLNLHDFSDPSAYFTAHKHVEGREVRILEMPGLWNGGMAGWLTRFVELPPAVFAPVKTVFDLCK